NQKRQKVLRANVLKVGVTDFEAQKHKEQEQSPALRNKIATEEEEYTAIDAKHERDRSLHHVFDGSGIGVPQPSRETEADRGEGAVGDVLQVTEKPTVARIAAEKTVA